MIISKYDRQLRLWGHSGQRRLGEASIALLGCSGAGIEGIKNLILPGVGNIEIFDHRKIQLEDLSCSFFYGPEDVGKMRAQIAAQNLLEMNPDVKGKGNVEHPLELVRDNERLKKYTLVLIGDLKEKDTIEVSKKCWELDIPVIFITAIGFYCYTRLQNRMHIVESQKVASRKYYMRLDDPFPELYQHCYKTNIKQLFEKLSTIENGEERKQIINEIEHIPYPVILLQVADSIPKQKRKNSSAFLPILKQYEMRLPEGQRTNFIQAQKRTLDYFQTPDNFLPDIGIFDLDRVEESTINSERALLFMKACKQFFKRNKHLPQPTELPDMHSTTILYLQFKEIYKVQHEKDITEIQSILLQLFKQPTLSRAQISEYINQIDALQVISMKPYHEELQHLNNPSLPWMEASWRYILLAIRSVQRFQQEHDRFPLISDLAAVKGIADGLKERYGFEKIEDWRYIEEAVRVEGKTVISINSIAGAVAGQQAIKLITHCFTPVKSGYLYSGVESIGYSIDV